MKRNDFIDQYSRVNRKYETQYFKPVRKAIREKVKHVISRLKAGGVHEAERYLHSDLGNPEMEKVIRELYLTVGKKHAQLNYSRLLNETRGQKSVKGFGFNAHWAQFILDYLKRFLTQKITFDIANTTRDALLRALTAMTVEGLGADQMIDKLENWPYERFQAARIVRTEVNRAANTGAKAQASTSEFQQLKEWIAIHDNRTRGNPITGNKDHANHWALDKVKIDEDDQFHDSRNGDILDFPGDPKASAASTINCRCTVAFTFKRDSRGNLIPKRRSTTVIYPGSQVQRPIITI